MRFVSLAFVLVACAGSPPPVPIQPRDPVELGLRTLETYADRACACTDERCAVALDDEIAAAPVSKELSDVFANPDGSIRVEVAMQRSVRCMYARGVVGFGFESAALEITEAMVKTACACTTAACSDAVHAHAVRWMHLVAIPMHEAARESLTTTFWAARACWHQAVEDTLADLETLRQRACTCADPGCAADVRAGFDAWAERYKDVNGRQSEADQALAMIGEMEGCLETARGATP